MNRVTVLVPAMHRESANHTHVALGKAQDLNTYIAPTHQDAGGNLYHVSSGLWTDAQIAGVQNPSILTTIELPEGSKADLVKVAEAQANFTLGKSGAASTTKIIAIQSDDPHGVIAAAGLAVIPVEI